MRDPTCGRPPGRLPEDERQGKPVALDGLIAALPLRRWEEVEQELAELRMARRLGGRRSMLP